jgi:selenocysteine lyase/cysteine desulfurase
MVQHEHDSGDAITYLDNAGQAPLAESIKAVGMDTLQKPPWGNHADNDQAKIRSLFAGLIQADPKDIAMMPSTAFAITLAATNVLRNNRREGKVFLLQDQMCSAVYAWENICEQSHGITLDIIPYPSTDGGWTAAVLEHLDDSVIVACLPQIHWSDGAILDLEAIASVCRENNTMLIVDATQSIGIMPFDVNAIQPALVACSVHKWLRGPSGLSLVYVSSDVHDSWGPLDQHGRSREVAIDNGSSWDASKNEMGPNGYPADFCKDARKFDSGGKPNPILFPMIRTALELVVELDVPQVQDDLKQLTKPIIEWALANGFVLTPGPHAGHLIGIRPAPGSQLTPSRMIQIANQLQSEGIYMAVRCGAFRISPYIDTDSSDIQRLLDALERHCK